MLFCAAGRYSLFDVSEVHLLFTHGASGYPVNVLLPTDYDEQRTYPVLYILHGYWDTQDWMARDAVGLNVMLGNLWASGEAEEMIVVLPYIFCDQELRSCAGVNLRNSLL